MRATDIEHLISVSRPTVHPSGAFAVVASSRPSIDANANVGQLWRVSLSDGARRRITQGKADGSPAFTPDGEQLLFIRGDENDKPQVWIMRADGGEAEQVTAHKGGVREFAISPDGSRVAFVGSDVEHGRRGTVEGVSPAQESPRRITNNRYLGNGVGYTGDAFAHVFIVDVPEAGREPVYKRAATPHDGVDGHEIAKPLPKAPEATRLTHGQFDHYGVSFSADGAFVLAITARHDTRDVDLRNSVIELNPATPEAEPHTVISAGLNLSVSEVASLSGGGFAMLAMDVTESGRDFVAKSVALMVLDRPGGTLSVLTDPETIDLGEVGSHLTVTDAGMLVQQRSRGRSHLLRVTASGVEALTSADVEVLGHGVAGETIALAVATPTSYGEVAVVDAAADGNVRVLTDFGGALQAAGIASATELDIPRADGTGTVHGWVWVPEGPGPHPVLLNIHGGPHASYGVHVFDEAQVAVDAGYAVVQCNPRGSAGYGRDHGVAIQGAMGTVDLDDVLTFLEGAISKVPGLDAERLGVMGGSYGGYLTAWTIAHDHRFTAAIVERGYLDPLTFIGTSDIGWFFSDEYTGSDVASILEQSPFAKIDQVKTPALVLHSELDFRCPLEQAQRYYAALKRNGVETELLVFPGENHELTRSGQPRHRIERFEHVMAWWAKHLPTASNHQR